LLIELPKNSGYLWVSAFETKVHNLDQMLSDVHERFPGVSSQLVDLDCIAGSKFLAHACYNALKSFQSKHPISKSLGMEMLLFLGATRQIGDSIKRVGLNEGTTRIGAVILGSEKQQVALASEFLVSLLKAQNDELIDQWNPARIEKVRKILDIGDKEIEAIRRKGERVESAVERLAIERSALLEIKK